MFFNKKVISNDINSNTRSMTEQDKERIDIFNKISDILKDDFKYTFKDYLKYGILSNDLMVITINDNMSLNISFSYRASPKVVQEITVLLLCNFVVVPDDDFLYDGGNYLFGLDNIQKLIENPINYKNIKSIEIN